MKIACVLLAAGAGTRFGSNKLMHVIEDKPMIEHTLELHATLPYHSRLLLTRKEYRSIVALAIQYGFHVLFNDAPERGIGSSTGIAAKTLLHTDVAGALFTVCDQPYLQVSSVEHLLHRFYEQPENIVAASYGDHRGNPCIFPRTLFPELVTLEGECGGSVIIARHMNRLVLVEVADVSELADIDTMPQEL